MQESVVLPSTIHTLSLREAVAPNDRQEEEPVTSEKSRRFTDREVALVLRKASELDEAEGAGEGGGLSLHDLEQIAAEVGIAPSAVHRAVAQLDARPMANPFARGQLVRQAVRAVEGELSRGSIAELMQHVDASSDQVGVVTDALGVVRWTAQDRFRTTQVAVSPSKGETRIRVIERVTGRFRRLATAVPTMTASALAAMFAGQLGPGTGTVVAVTALGGAVGALIGRFLWTHLSSESQTRVNRLASELSRNAEASLQIPDAARSDDPPSSGSE
jgi:hypothetical protein